MLSSVVWSAARRRTSASFYGSSNWPTPHIRLPYLPFKSTFMPLKSPPQACDRPPPNVAFLKQAGATSPPCGQMPSRPVNYPAALGVNPRCEHLIRYHDQLFLGPVSLSPISYRSRFRPWLARESDPSRPPPQAFLPSTYGPRDQ